MMLVSSISDCWCEYKKKDGWTRVILDIHAYQYTLKKYLKAKQLIKADSGA